MNFGRVRGDDVLRSSIQCSASQWTQRMSIHPIWCRSLSSLRLNGRPPLGKFIKVDGLHLFPIGQHVMLDLCGTPRSFDPL